MALCKDQNALPLSPAEEGVLRTKLRDDDARVPPQAAAHHLMRRCHEEVTMLWNTSSSPWRRRHSHSQELCRSGPELRSQTAWQIDSGARKWNFCTALKMLKH